MKEKGFCSTYKGLKHQTAGEGYTDYCGFCSTYKGLKPKFESPSRGGVDRFYSTYEGLKLLYGLGKMQDNFVFTLPVRD